ncbi:MAG: hypothetical protein KF869_01430 [Phycisphaeraceae bacterium]|nr:hypothetical protein [Phycisphaeraceae bacterium]
MNTRVLRAAAVLAGVAGLAAGGVLSAHASQPEKAPPPARRAEAAPRTFEDALLAEIRGQVGALADARSLTAARGEFDRLFDLAATRADLDKRPDVLIEAAAWRRLVGQLAALKAEDRDKAMPLLLANPVTARTLAMALREEDRPADVYAVFLRLAENPRRVQDSGGLAPLVAAVCVVHDRPVFPPRRGDGLTPAQVRERERNRTANRNAPAAPRGAQPALPPAQPIDPVAVFDYLAGNAGRMVFDPRQLPTELLTYVVNTRAPIDELRWALQNYAGNRMIGRVYSTIIYDTAAFRYGREKKIWQTDGGYTLQNIRKVGGVCEEQAYFAAHCGKAIGVPTVEVSVTGPDVSHAYVGYLVRGGKGAAWDFREGRYDEYEDIRGNVTDPQTGARISHSHVGLTAGLLETPVQDRLRAVALLDVVARLREAGTATAEPATPGRNSTRRTLAGEPPANWPAPTAAGRTPDAATRNALLRMAANVSPFEARVWTEAAKLAETGALGASEKNDWCRAVMSMCGRSAPDFAMEIVAPLISGSGDAREQDRLWDWCAQQFTARPDLVARARFNQAEAWAAAKNPGKAWTILRDVAMRYPNDGTVIVDALRAAERLLADEGKPAIAAIDLYEDAFRRISKPGQLSPGFARQSNFYRVGRRLAALYEAAGQQNKAKMIMSRIEVEDE